MDRLSPAGAARVARRAKQAVVGADIAMMSRSGATRVNPPLPAVVHAELGAGLSLDVGQLTAAALPTFKHAASMANPKFYECRQTRIRWSGWRRYKIGGAQVAGGRDRKSVSVAGAMAAVRALAKASRNAELAAAKAHAQQPGDTARCSPVPADGRHVISAISPIPPPTAPSTHAPRTESPNPPGDPPVMDVKVPATAATLAQWVTTWVRMCADSDLVRGPLNNNEHARTAYDLSAKQLRNIRNAATSGALRRRADQLGLPLPAGYVDRPVNGQKLAPA